MSFVPPHHPTKTSSFRFLLMRRAHDGAMGQGRAAGLICLSTLMILKDERPMAVIHLFPPWQELHPGSSPKTKKKDRGNWDGTALGGSVMNHQEQKKKEVGCCRCCSGYRCWAKGQGGPLREAITFTPDTTRAKHCFPPSAPLFSLTRPQHTPARKGGWDIPS